MLGLLQILEPGEERGIIPPDDMAAQFAGLSELDAELDGRTLIIRVPSKPDDQR